MPKGVVIMLFFIGMFICNLFVPILMLLAGYMMYKHPPKNINSFFGYRTRQSCRSLKAWKFAHNYCGRLWVKLGAILLLPTVVVQLPFMKSSADVIGWITIVVESIQLAVMIASVFYVENVLKKEFDCE